MRALTLKQPWLYAIEHLGKRVENRSWDIPFRLRGHWIALQAGKSRDDLERFGVISIHGLGTIPPWTELTFGSVSSVVKFSQVIIARKELVPESTRKWFFGPSGWMITDLVLLKEPIPCRGMLGLWTVPADIEEQIKAQLPMPVTALTISEVANE